MKYLVVHPNCNSCSSIPRQYLRQNLICFDLQKYTACHIAGSGYKLKVGRQGEAAGAITSSKRSFTLYPRFVLNS